MIDTTEHILIPVDKFGDSPCADDDAAYYICWCGEAGCHEWADGAAV